MAVVAVAIGFQKTPEPSAAASPPAAPLIVSVAHAGEAVAHVGFPTPITVRALGSEPIVAVELWAGAHRLAEATNSGGGPAQAARWTWTPASAGPTILVARATDRLGRQAQSGPLRVQVEGDPPVIRPVRQVVADAGETAEAAARRAGGETADLSRWNAGLDPATPLDAGTIVFVPLAIRDAPGPSEGKEIMPVGSIGPGPLLADTGKGGTATLASWTGAGPEVTLNAADGAGLFVPATVTPKVDGCGIELVVSSDAANATGLAVYGLAPDATTFTRVATFAAEAGIATWRTPAPAGSYLFSVSTFDDNAEEHGDLFTLDVPVACADPGWTGKVGFDAGRLVVDAAPDRAYVYLSLDGGPYRRLPADAGAFVDRIGGTLDFGPHLPPDLAAHEVDVEAWGWGGTGLLDLGSGHHEPSTSQPPPVGGAGGSDLFAGGTFTALDWVTRQFVPGTQEFQAEDLLLRDGGLAVWTTQGVVKSKLENTFRWVTNGTGVDALVWQVAAFPMPADMAPDVPGVLMQQVVSLKDGTQGGDFPIDFRPIFAPSVETADIGDTTSGGLVEQLTMAQLGALASAPPSAVPPTQANTQGSAANSQSYSPAWLLSSFTPSVLYVRAIPMDGTKVAASVSNFVKFTVTGDDPSIFDPSHASPTSPTKPTPSPGALKPYQLYLQFLPPATANPNFAECVIITGWQPGYVALGLATGDFLCRAYPSTGGWTLAGAFEDFVDFVADAWDAVAGAWAWIQAEFVKALAKYSGCSAIAGGGFCEKLAKVAISVALTAAGIPPSLPNSQELIALGKGELKEALADLASEAVFSLTGVDPCSAAELVKAGVGTSSCEDLAGELVDMLVAQLDQLKTDEAVALTGVQVPPGAIAVPHPWGQLRPPRFRITIARNTAVPLPAVGCRMTLSMGATVTNWSHKSWSEATKSWTTVTQTVSGAPFSALSIPVPNPETATTPVFELPSTLGPDASIYEIMFAALNKKLVTNRDYYLADVAFWREPGNPVQLHVPGKGYVSQVDQSNHGWVLLQNGTPVIAQIARTPASPDCFDTVVVAGKIPVVDQGFPCVPSQAFYWKLEDEPFVGTPELIAGCKAMYANAFGY